MVKTLAEDKFTHAMHGTTNANIRNMLIGVSEGYKRLWKLWVSVINLIHKEKN